MSPLLSLMEDQVRALNNTVGAGAPPVAVYLGSSQFDSSADEHALAGKYPLVYVTPEKLVGSSFLSRLNTLYLAGRIGLVAIDEVSPVSRHRRGDVACRGVVASTHPPPSHPRPTA